MSTIVPLSELGEIRAELARQKEIAEELGVPVADLLTQQLVAYRRALHEARKTLADAGLSWDSARGVPEGG